MNVTVRNNQLKKLFSLDKRVDLENGLEIIPFRFTQVLGTDEIDQLQKGVAVTSFCTKPDCYLEENKQFVYKVFAPKGKTKFDKAILMLHGLNERTWDKYLIWAEYLVQQTGRPVILFPLAFHMNRTPADWGDPHVMFPWSRNRKAQYDDLRNSTFFNVSLSERLTIDPSRFYIGMRQSFYNTWQLLREIKNGLHPLFEENASINILAYSIGAMLSEMLLYANVESLTRDTRLLMFCGGSLFSQMCANAKDILDKKAHESLYYYMHYVFPSEAYMESLETRQDLIERSFRMMVSCPLMKNERESFFSATQNRIHAITLKQDTVIPTVGVRLAVGEELADKMVEELDFPYLYTHQIPFPDDLHIDSALVDESFYRVFSEAATFLA